MKELLERLKALADKPASKWSKSDRDFVAEKYAEYGKTIEGKCKECYRDAAVVLYTHYKAESEEIPESAYVLRDGLDVYFKGMRINAATITDERAEALIKDGFPIRFFKVIPDGSK